MATSELKLNLEHVRLERNEVVRHAASLRTALSSLDTREQGGFIRLPHRTDLLSEIQNYRKKRPTGITDVVQLGIGGSSLGGHAICAALLPARHNEFVGKGQLRYHFADNVDPESFGALLDALEPRKTLVHVVSKTGGTLETACLGAPIQRPAHHLILGDACLDVVEQPLYPRNIVQTYHCPRSMISWSISSPSGLDDEAV